jgi:hypothetical protein
MIGKNEIVVGDFVYILSAKQQNPLPKSSKGVIFSQIDTDWFRVYVTWEDQTRIQDFPRWMLKKVVDFPQ